MNDQDQAEKRDCGKYPLERPEAEPLDQTGAKSWKCRCHMGAKEQNEANYQSRHGVPVCLPEDGKPEDHSSHRLIGGRLKTQGRLAARSRAWRRVCALWRLFCLACRGYP